MEDTIDPRTYATMPRMDVRAGVALGHAVLTAAPATSHPLVEREIGRVRATLADLERAWQPLALVDSPNDKRPADLGLDGSWSALYQRLSAWTRLVASNHTEVGEAQGLLGALFPDGLTFVRLPYEREWAESQRRLDHIDIGGLGVALDGLCGPAFLAAVRAAHAHYGAVLGITAVASEPIAVSQSLHAPFAAFRDALQRYVQRLIGTFDDEDPEAVRAVKAALRPIDELRAAVAARLERAAMAAAAAQAPVVESTPVTPPAPAA